MAYKLAISDEMDVPVKGSLNNGGKPLSFSFSLRMSRLDFDKYMAVVDRLNRETDSGELDEPEQPSKLTLNEFIKTNTLGWSGQRLVVDDATGAPAEFSADALGCLLQIVGMAPLCLQSYIRAYDLSQTPEGRRGN